MLKVIPLRYGTIFRKVFGDREVFNRFVSDALDMTVEVDAVRQEYRYPTPVGKGEYDLFGEDVARRVIVEVQHIRERDFFDRFLHDTCLDEADAPALEGQLEALRATKRWG